MQTRIFLRAAFMTASMLLAACGGGSDPGEARAPESVGALATSGGGFLGEAGKATQLPCLMFGTGCTSTGGGTGGTGTGITGFFVDAPTMNALYGCNPSGRPGVTTSTGEFSCAPGDTSVDFYISTGLGDAINLGNAKLPASSGQSIPVTQLAINGLGTGLKAAEILHTLDHSTNDSIMDVGDIHLPQAVVDQINLYVRTSGTLPAGITTDDAFLAYVQDADTGTVVFKNRPGATANSFLIDVVMPHLQNTIAGISATNPPPAPVVNGTTRLSGTIVVSGSGVLDGGELGAIPWSAAGGGVMNAVVSGNITQPGQYNISFSSPGFTESVSVGPINIPPPAGPIPRQTTTAQVPPINGNTTISIGQGFGGRSITIATASNVAGCVGGNTIGQDIGLSNPMITLTTSVTCDVGFGAMTFTATTKLVGAP